MHRLIIEEDLVFITGNSAGKIWGVQAQVKHEKTGVDYILAWNDIPHEVVKTPRNLIAFLKDHKPDAIGNPERRNLIPISEIELIERTH